MEGYLQMSQLQFTKGFPRQAWKPVVGKVAEIKQKYES